MKHLKKILALALLAVSLCAVALPASATYSTMYVDGDVGVGYTVRLRSSMSTSNDDNILVNIPYGTAVSAEKVSGTNWHRVNWGGYSGYMLSSFLSTTDPLDAGWTARYGPGVMNSANGTSTQVSNLQNDLIYLGFSVGPTGADGYYGQNTTLAVRAFQAAYGLTVDGQAGPATKAALYDARFN